MLMHLNIRIFGRVQGVNFRSAAKSSAQRLGIAGFAKNEQGNTVYIEAEGQEENLNKFADWCRGGNSWSKVERVEVKQAEMQNFTEFAIL